MVNNRFIEVVKSGEIVVVYLTLTMVKPSVMIVAHG